VGRRRGKGAIARMSCDDMMRYLPYISFCLSHGFGDKVIQMEMLELI
jgi:hypothetical protein